MNILWPLILSINILGTLAFMWGYRRHLDALTGPWIANEPSRNE
jgi:hypothetical protein